MVNVYDTRIRDLETRFSGHLKDGKIKFRWLKYFSALTAIRASRLTLKIKKAYLISIYIWVVSKLSEY
jgi:hypothetical protein